VPRMIHTNDSVLHSKGLRINSGEGQYLWRATRGRMGMGAGAECWGFVSVWTGRRGVRGDGGPGEHGGRGLPPATRRTAL
jgi:hypothetical protein